MQCLSSPTCKKKRFDMPTRVLLCVRKHDEVHSRVCSREDVMQCPIGSFYMQGNWMKYHLCRCFYMSEKFTSRVLRKAFSDVIILHVALFSPRFTFRKKSKKVNKKKLKKKALQPGEILVNQCCGANITNEPRNVVVEVCSLLLQLKTGNKP